MCIPSEGKLKSIEIDLYSPSSPSSEADLPLSSPSLPPFEVVLPSLSPLTVPDLLSSLQHQLQYSADAVLGSDYRSHVKPVTSLSVGRTRVQHILFYLDAYPSWPDIRAQNLSGASVIASLCSPSFALFPRGTRTRSLAREADEDLRSQHLTFSFILLCSAASSLGHLPSLGTVVDIWLENHQMRRAES